LIAFQHLIKPLRNEILILRAMLICSQILIPDATGTIKGWNGREGERRFLLRIIL
jgi:hypothetical protein